MSLSRYRYFEKVARLGSIREAADALHVAPSAISRQIVQLEREFGTELFERRSRGMALTAAGQIVLQSARTLLDGIDHARSALDELHGLRRGHIRILTVEGMVSDSLYPVLAEFSARHPVITFEVIIASSDQLLQRLLDDDGDLAVAFDPRPDRNVKILATVPDPLVVATPPGHELAASTSVTLAELSRWPLALPDPTFGLRHAIDEAAAAGKIELRPVLVTNSIESLRTFARVGMGLALLTRIAVRRDVGAGLLLAVPLADRRLRTARVRLCVRQARKLPAPVMELARWLTRAMTARAAGDVAKSATVGR